MSDDRTCPHGKPINHDCGLCDLGQGAISRGPDPRDAEIARLREDVARLTAALAVHREAVLAAEWQQGGGVKLCGDDLVCGAMIWERKGVEMRDEHIPDCRIGRALSDPDGTAALEWVRGLEHKADVASVTVHRVRTYLQAHTGETTGAAAVRVVHERAEAIRERDEARDCGQDGVCAISPGCQRHWLERNGEIVRERDNAKRILAAIGERFGRLPSDESVMDAIDWYMIKVDALRSERDEARRVARMLSLAQAAVVASAASTESVDEWAARLGADLVAAGESEYDRPVTALDPQPAPAHPRREPSLCSMTADLPSGRTCGECISHNSTGCYDGGRVYVEHGPHDPACDRFMARPTAAPTEPKP